MKPYIIYHGKSKSRPFRVKTVAANGEVLNNSQGLTSRENAYKNIYATVRVIMPMMTNEQIDSLFVDDQTKGGHEG